MLSNDKSNILMHNGSFSGRLLKGSRRKSTPSARKNPCLWTWRRQSGDRSSSWRTFLVLALTFLLTTVTGKKLKRSKEFLEKRSECVHGVLQAYSRKLDLRRILAKLSVGTKAEKRAFKEKIERRTDQVFWRGLLEQVYSALDLIDKDQAEERFMTIFSAGDQTATTAIDLSINEKRKLTNRMRLWGLPKGQRLSALSKKMRSRSAPLPERKRKKRGTTPLHRSRAPTHGTVRCPGPAKGQASSSQKRQVPSHVQDGLSEKEMKQAWSELLKDYKLSAIRAQIYSKIYGPRGKLCRGCTKFPREMVRRKFINGYASSDKLKKLRSHLDKAKERSKPAKLKRKLTKSKKGPSPARRARQPNRTSQGMAVPSKPNDCLGSQESQLSALSTCTAPADEAKAAEPR